MSARPLSDQPNLDAAESLTIFPLRFWLLILVTGLGAGLGGAAFMLLLHFVQHVAWLYHTGDFLEATRRTSISHRWLILFGTGVLIAIVRKLLRWSTGGHGGEIAKAIWMGRARIPFWATLSKATFSIVVVGLGASLGREGAPKQVGAAIGSSLALWLKLSTNERRHLAACGAGAGIAAVYNVPLGGALFACEVLLGQLSLPLVVPALTATSIATMVSWLVLPHSSTYETVVRSIHPDLFLGAIITGIVAGPASALYVRLVAWAAARRPQGWKTFSAPLIVFVGLAATASLFPEVLGNGKDVVQLALDARLSLPMLLVLLILRPIASLACMGCGTPGGLFTPTITVGALLGGFIAGGTPLLNLHADVGAWAILSAAAFLAATSKGPLSALVLVMELIGHLDALVVPLMITIALATFICQRMESRSIYSARIHPAQG